MSKIATIAEENPDISVKKDSPPSPTRKKDSAIGLLSRFLRFDSLSKKSNSVESPSSTEPPVTYYGVYIPCEIKKGPDEEALHVYKNKAEALELVKRYKTSRFKAFRNRPDAVSFALHGADIESHDGNENSLVGEKPYPFKAPSPQDMVSLRKAIEAGLLCTVRDRVWDNPRYLVSSGSTPAILQEGSRYNALHVAAKAMNADICNLILTTVGNPAFVQSLYGADADLECCKEFSSILVDRYLNTPDKAMNETPLHFASKYGAEKVVEVLTSFPQCNRDATNKYGEKPRDIICKRTAGTPETISRISALLTEHFYVPVLHSDDGSDVPAIGTPFTPSHPPSLNPDPLSPRYEIRAFAGPMEARDADHFRRKWKTPPRSLQPPTFRLKDFSKGLESVGRNLAEEMKVGWKEYWPFLDTFTDLRTPEGLSLLENYLRTKYDNAISFACNESKIPQTPDDLTLSRISFNISQMTPPKENMSPITELCVAMKTCSLANERLPHWRRTDPIRQRICRQPNKIAAIVNGDASPPHNNLNQLLCIERTCQVFAKRIADALTFSLTAEPEIAGESLKSEAKHLQHTMFTYMDDERFSHINFALIHSRLAQLVVFKLKQQSLELDDVNSLVEFLVKLRCPNDDIFSSDDEPKNYRGPTRVKLNHVIDCHVRCLAAFISEELVESDVSKGPSISQSECSDIWEKASKCNCDWKIVQFDRNSKKNASYRKNRSILSTSPKTDSIVKRLSFDYDMGDVKSADDDEEKPVNINSPAGDGMLFTIDVDKCTVVEAEISDDDSSEHSDEYHTASEHSAAEDEMADASDQAVAEPFIYGEEPTKMDRLVLEALANTEISMEEYPNIYRWKHAVSLYPPEERNKWQPIDLDVSLPSPVTYTFNLGQTLASSSRSRRTLRDVRCSPSIEKCSTPKKENSITDFSCRSVPLQVSSWLRITGPNSPKGASATKTVGHNVSFGF